MKPKILFIPLIKKEKLNKPALAKLPSTIYIVIVYTIQYKKIAEQLKKYLEKQKKKILGFQQILGCTKLKSKQPILLIADGNFHAANLLEQGNEVYLFDNHNLTKLNKQPDNKTKLAKFYDSSKIGMLLSTKPGQYNLNKARRIKLKLEKQNKKSYFFLTDNISLDELENFNIGFWLNTACPGLARDSKKIVNIEDLN